MSAHVIYLSSPVRKADRAALDTIDKAIGELFARLAEKHGPFAVTTVALDHVAEAIEHARRKHRPIEDAWLADLAHRFEKAMRGK